MPRLLAERLSRFYDKEVDRWIKFEHGRIKELIEKILSNVDWNDLPRLGSLRIDWYPLVEYVEAVTPPVAHHNESADWGIFWLLESKLDYAKQLVRYSQFRMNQKDVVLKEQYPIGECPEPAEREEGESLTEEEFEEFLEYAGKKQHELREEDEKHIVREHENDGESEELDDSYFMNEEE